MDEGWRILVFEGPQILIHLTISASVSNDDVYHSFIKTLPALSKFPTLFYSRTLLFSTMARHYWVHIYNTLEAKQRYLEPDLLEFT